jgi:hypothetical protein
MAFTDGALDRPDSEARRLLSGDVEPAEYARRIVPPPRPRGRVRIAVSHWINAGLFLGSACALALALSTTGHASIPAFVFTGTSLLVALLPLWWFAKVVDCPPVRHFGDRHDRLVRPFRYLRRHRHRDLSHELFVADLAAMVSALPAEQLTSDFIARIVAETRGQLLSVGVSEPSICLLRPEFAGRLYVSYFAGDHIDALAAGTVVSPAIFHAQKDGRRRVVYLDRWSLGLEPHSFVVLATRRDLDRADAQMLRQVGHLVQKACTH